MASEIHAEGGSVDIVMNVAGVSTWGTIERLRHSDWREMVEVDLMGPVSVLECFVPPMIEAGHGGHVVNVSSAAGLLGLPWHGAYSAAKFGLRGFVYALREDLLGRPIRITTVDAGLVESEFSLVRYRGDAEAAKAVYAGVDPVTPEEVADCVLFALTRPPHVNVDELVVKATAQSSGARVVRRED